MLVKDTFMRVPLGCLDSWTDIQVDSVGLAAWLGFCGFEMFCLLALAVGS